jgi:hypothetical protein
MNTPMPSPGDFFPPELAHLLGPATQVIDQHVNVMAIAPTAGRHGHVSVLA